MNRFQAGFLVVSIFAGAVSCASQGVPPPKSLVDARANYARAREGIAAQYAPATLRDAGIALDDAEQAWRRAPGEQRTVDLAVMADHKIFVAKSQAMALKTQHDARRTAAEHRAPAQRLPEEAAEPRMGVTAPQPQERQGSATEVHLSAPK